MTQTRTATGHVETGFEPVIDAFLTGISPEPSGAALSLWIDGREVVNVWAGLADAEARTEWSADTVSAMFSVSKGLSAIVIGRLVDAGLLDLDAPIASVWPEFGAHGKGAVSIGDALAHRAGVSAPRDDLELSDLADTRSWAARLAAQEPLWAPGEAYSYHALTYGTIADEIVWRTTGRTLIEVFDEEIAAPLGADVSFAADKGMLARRTRLTTSPEWDRLAVGDGTSETDWALRALTLGGSFPPALVVGDRGFNDPAVASAGLPAATALGTASAVARIWSAVVTPTLGHRLLSDEAIEALLRVRSSGAAVFGAAAPYPAWGAGVQVASPGVPHLSPSFLGHGGAGGQAGFGDLTFRVGIGYCRNRLDIVDAMPPIYEALRPLL
ncbi:serine hydrolase domain-containing protein [Salinibacterium soli]|uniref:Serine hydrolase domain-containing protein n=1 Tax=Antiquaquibacter soli TaxID=3064523 RepID=A0ABT9BP02_9MICO|nr:serine hydrolase domain-containing protein [Protaetiibacter sp. WY-16]MDO7882750.1 serine hydrolase domain-containing protein [Protaetiibacter sp. WY-16]